VREAIRQDPHFASAYNTLGVVYERHHDLLHAVRVFAYVLQQDPDDVSVLSNLADAQDRLGNAAEANALRVRLGRLDPNPPYYYFNLGMAAMRSGDFRAAKALFAKEVARADYNAEFHFWLALAYVKLDDPERAQRQLGLAVERSSVPPERNLYAAKLAWLQSGAHESAQGRNPRTPVAAPQ